MHNFKEIEIKNIPSSYLPKILVAGISKEYQKEMYDTNCFLPWLDHKNPMYHKDILYLYITLYVYSLITLLLSNYPGTAMHSLIVTPLIKAQLTVATLRELLLMPEL